MFEFSNLPIKTAVANQGGAMEADTILKNGRSSKSRMSRGNFLTNIFKKISIVAIAATINVAVYAQDVEVGVQAGVNFTTFSGWIRTALESNWDGDVFAISKKPGIQFGLHCGLFPKRPNFGTHIDVLFSQLGTRIEANEVYYGNREVRETGTINLNCFLTRLHSQYRFDLNNDMKMALHAGIHGGYALWANFKYERTENGEKVDGNSDSFFGDDIFGRAADLGIGFGAAFTFQKYRIGLDYDLGILFHNLSFSLTYMFK